MFIHGSSRILIHMKSLFDPIVGLLAPHQCIVCAREGSAMCDQCLQSAGEPIQPRCAGCKQLSDDHKTCSSCRSWLDIYAVYAAVPYQGIYEQLVRSYKFDVQRSAAKPMAQLMDEIVKSFPSDFVICQLPTAPTRIRLRGFDHASLLTKRYAQLLGKKPQKLLSRHTNNRQLGSSRDQRMKQMKTEFYVSKAEMVAGKSIVLVDDVMTTGATLAGAAKVLRAAGAKRVYAVVFAQAG